MKALKACSSLLAVLVVGTLVGCSTTSMKTANVSDSANQDRDKGREIEARLRIMTATRLLNLKLAQSCRCV